MDTGMLNSFHNEEEQFSVVEDSHADHSHCWSSDTQIDSEVSLLPSDDPENLRRTLSDLSRHLASYTTLKSEDYMVQDGLPADIFEQTPSPSQAEKFSFSPRSIAACQEMQGADALLPLDTADHNTPLRGDNRLMDNDNTSPRVFATVDSVYYDIQSQVPDEKYVTYHNICECDETGIEVSSSIQIISVDPDSYEFDSPSNRSLESSRCSSPVDYSSDSDVEEESANENEVPEDDAHSIRSTEESRETVNNTSDADFVSESYKALQMERNFTVNSSNMKMRKLKSFSLPQSPKHVAPELESLDLHCSLTLEDLKSLDFSELVDSDINISPGKSFNKNFDISDVFDVPVFTDNIDFNNVSSDLKEVGIENDSSVARENSRNNESSSDVLSVIEKDGIVKDIDGLDLFPRMEDCDLEVGDGFDLPAYSYLMGDINGEPELEENFVSSLITSNSTSCKAESDTDELPAASTPIKKTEMVAASRYNLELTPPKKSVEKLKLGKPVPLSLSQSSTCGVSPVTRVKESPKEDTEDYVDVEGFSDGESTPVLAANTMDSLLEQFEASQNMECNKILSETQHKLEVKSEARLSPSWCPLLPFTVISGKSKGTPWTDSSEKSPKVVSPDSAFSAHNTSTESIQLDHDYCSPVRRVQRQRTLSSGTEGDSDPPRTTPADTFLSPQSSDISTVYRLMSNNRKLGIGKGKNISMCITEPNEHYTEDLDSSPSLSEASEKITTPKLEDYSLIRQSRCSDLSDSDCSMSDHSYSKADFGKTKINRLSNGNGKRGSLTAPDLSKLIKKTSVSKSFLVSDAQVKKSPPQTVINNNCDKNSAGLGEDMEAKIVQSILFKNDSEKQKVTKNCAVVPAGASVKGNKNSLLISNFKTNRDTKDGTVRKTINGNPEVVFARQKQSLLKPTVRNEIKLASLLKSNNYPPKKVQHHEAILKPSENVAFSPLITTQPEQPTKATETFKPKENNVQVLEEQVDKKLPLKRKLNLEEYKKRRGNNTRSCDSSRTCSPVGHLSENWAFSSPNSPANPDIIPKVEGVPSVTEMLQNVLIMSKHGAVAATAATAVPAVVVPTTVVPVEVKVSVKEEVVSKPTVPREQEKKLFDPIAEASKKAIQLKKLSVAKKCNEDKMVESKIPKVENVVILPMVTENGKILPMIKNVQETLDKKPAPAPLRRKMSDYEEIVMVSIGVNTNPVLFLDKEEEMKVDNLMEMGSDNTDTKPGIQFKIKQKSKVVQGNVFHHNLVDLQDSPGDSAVDCNSTEERKPDKSNHKVTMSNHVIETLSSIKATLKKVEMTRDLKITSNSLLASIEDVVQKKTSNRSPDIDNDLSHRSSAKQGQHRNDKAKIDRMSSKNSKPVEEVNEASKGVNPAEMADIAEASKLEHGEDKVIMHLKKDRKRPDMCSISVQTDDNVRIKEYMEEFTFVVEDNSQDVIPNLPTAKEIPENSSSAINISKNNVQKKKIERSYRQRRGSSRSASSDSSVKNEASNGRWKERKNSKDYSSSGRKTISLERSRKSYSPKRSRSRYRSRSSSRWNRGNGDRRRYNNRHCDSRYSRRSRSLSRSRRRRYSSRDRKDSRGRSYSRNIRERSRSWTRNCSRDDRSVRSVNLTSKRKRVYSRSSYESRTPPRTQNKKVLKERKMLSPMRRTGDLERPQKKEVESTIPPSSAEVLKESNGRKERARRRKLTETSAISYESQYSRSHRSYSQSSDDSDGRCSSSSSSSSSSSDSSSGSDSSAYRSGSESPPPSIKDKRYDNIVMLAPPNLPRAKAKHVEERRVVFVGGLEAEITKADLRVKFIKYGQVMEVTLHQKEDGTRYGFVTFAQAEQSYRVVERAGGDADLQHYDVSFGGRRAFCRNFYSDLDNLETVEEPECYSYAAPPANPSKSFDSLLQEMKAAVFAKKAKGSKV